MERWECCEYPDVLVHLSNLFKIFGETLLKPDGSFVFRAKPQPVNIFVRSGIFPTTGHCSGEVSNSLVHLDSAITPVVRTPFRDSEAEIIVLLWGDIHHQGWFGIPPNISKGF